MSNAIDPVADLFRRLDKLGDDQNDLAEAMELSADKVSKIRSGVRALRPHEQEAALAYLRRRERERAGAGRLHPDQPQVKTVDVGETAQVQRMDLSYALGPGTNVDEDYIEGEAVTLDIGFLRTLTPSAPSKLRIVDGIGDSMFPTIHDRDWLILDLGQNDLNLDDRIWAISLNGAGQVKRIQTRGKGQVAIISDNKSLNLPERVVDTDEVFVVGRIVGSIRRH